VAKRAEYRKFGTDELMQLVDLFGVSARGQAAVCRVLA